MFLMLFFALMMISAKAQIDTTVESTTTTTPATTTTQPPIDIQKLISSAMFQQELAKKIKESPNLRTDMLMITNTPNLTFE